MERRPRLLLIDNDPDLVEALRIRLEHEGYECVTACTGAQGLIRFLDEPFDLVISDLNMPGGDGVDLITRIREASDVPVVVVTGFRDDYRRSLRSIGNVTTLRKPFQPQSLLSIIEAELALTQDPAPTPLSTGADDS